MVEASTKKVEGGRETASLLQRVRAQDQAAWERLVRLCSPLIYLWCVGAGLSPADANDVGRDVFVDLARRISSFRPDNQYISFRDWLHTLVYSQLLQHGKVPASVADMPSATEEASTLLHRRAVELIREEFPAVTWQAFRRLTLEGQRPEAVAAELGLSGPEVYLARARVLHRLREEFADLIDF